MIIECPNCHSRYNYGEDRFDGKPSKKIKCAKCQHVFEIFRPGQESGGQAPAPVPETPAPSERTGGAPVLHKSAAPAPPPPGEATNMRRAPKPAKPVETTEEAVIPSAAPSKPTSLQMPIGRRLSLAIIDGPDAGSVFRIEKPRVTIGRSNADLTLNDSEASRQHAAVEVRDTLFTLVDLGSTNGTLFEGQRVDGSIELQNHAEFVVGNSTLMLIVTEE